MNSDFKINSNFDEYIKTFLIENSKHNLISKNDEKLIFEKHIYDSLALKLFIQKYNIKNARILDIGCGGGFPCAPISIEFPDFEITGIDSIRKKINSVNSIKETLKLNNLNLICDRVENLKDKFDVVISRAVADMKKLCEYALPRMKKGGYFVAYKSKKALIELDNAKEIIQKYNAQVVDIIEYQLPLADIYERNLVVIKL